MTEDEGQEEAEEASEEELEAEIEATEQAMNNAKFLIDKRQQDIEALIAGPDIITKLIPMLGSEPIDRLVDHPISVAIDDVARMISSLAKTITREG